MQEQVERVEPLHPFAEAGRRRTENHLLPFNDPFDPTILVLMVYINGKLPLGSHRRQIVGAHN